MQPTRSQWANWSKTDRSLTYQTGYLISVHNSRLDQCTQFQNYVSDISEHGFNFTRFREHSPCTWTQTKSWKSLHFPFICHLVLTAFKKKNCGVHVVTVNISATKVPTSLLQLALHPACVYRAGRWHRLSVSLHRWRSKSKTCLLEPSD